MSDPEGIESPDSISEDAVYEVLADSWRRRALARLVAHDRTVTLNDLTKELVVREAEAPITEVPGEKLTRVASSLHHCHLPKLVENGIVTYDTDRRVIEPTERLGQIEPYLSADDEGATVASVALGSRR